MKTKQFVGPVIIFLLGFLVAAIIYHVLPPAGRGGTGEVLSQLSSKSSSAPLGSNDIVKAVSKLEPAVVNIDTVGEPVTPLGGFPDLMGGDSPFGQPEPIIPKGAGSGILISRDGYIVTNNHVIENAAKITVRLSGSDKKYPGKIIGADAKSDIAVIKIDGNNFPYAQLGDSDNLRVGDWAIAIGNPLALGTTVTVGVISATNRTNLEVGDGKILERAIQTDASINQGNSGGALANIRGEVVGINSAIASTSPGAGSIGIGFAIPINTVKSIAKQLIKQGRVIRPWIGIQYQSLTPDLKAQFQIPFSGGVIVAAVMPGSPAAKAGLREADVIAEVDKKKLSNVQDLGNIVKKHKVGDTLMMRIYRGGQYQFVTVKLGEMPSKIQR